MDMQKHSLFARIEARDLSPAAPPTTAGSETKKSAKRQFSSRSMAKSPSVTPTTPISTNTSNGTKVNVTVSNRISSMSVSLTMCQQQELCYMKF